MKERLWRALLLFLVVITALSLLTFLLDAMMGLPLILGIALVVTLLYLLLRR